jgi:hypothetical protein
MQADAHSTVVRYPTKRKRPYPRHTPGTAMPENVAFIAGLPRDRRPPDAPPNPSDPVLVLLMSVLSVLRDTDPSLFSAIGWVLAKGYHRFPGDSGFAKASEILGIIRDRT